MYEAFYGLNKRPFLPVPNPEIFVPVPPAQEALEAILGCVERGQGIAVLTGEAGIGKTAVCRQLQEVLQRNYTPVYLSSCAFPTRRALLQAILYELKIDYLGLSEQEARLRFLDAARGASATSKPLVLILDEAHLLSTRLFEELRTIGDMTDDGTPLVRLVFAGQFSLEEKLAEPTLSAFNQRIGVQVYVEPLSLQQSADYLLARLAWAGARSPETLFTEAALTAICRAAGGNPRCLHQLGDHSLFLAFAEEQKPVDIGTVRIALDDLKELPLQWNDLSVEMDLLEQQQAYNEQISREAAGLEFPDEITRFHELTPDRDSLLDTDEYELARLFSAESSDAENALADVDPPASTSAPDPDAELEEAETIPFAVIEVGSGLGEDFAAAEPEVPHNTSWNIFAEAVEEQPEVQQSPLRPCQPTCDVDQDVKQDSVIRPELSATRPENSAELPSDCVINIASPAASRKGARGSMVPVELPPAATSTPRLKPDAEVEVSRNEAPRPAEALKSEMSAMLTTADCQETPIYDHYALIDRRDELPEDRKATVTLGTNPRPQYAITATDLESDSEYVARPLEVKTVDLMPAGWQTCDSEEQQLLDSIHTLREELEHLRSHEGPSRNPASPPVTWREFDVIQVIREDETVFDPVTVDPTPVINEPPQFTEAVELPAAAAEPTVSSCTEPVTRRFAQLFTRLRWRREQLQQQHSEEQGI